MDDLSKDARLVEEVIRRVLQRYQEHLHPEDYHRRSLDVAIADLPSLVTGALQKIREETRDPDEPSPYDLGATARLRRAHTR